MMSNCKSVLLHYYNHFTALWTLSGTTQVSQYQKVHFAIFWIFWCKMKITQADTPTIWMDCHPIHTNWCPSLLSHNFYARYPSWHNPPNLSCRGTGNKYAGLHTRWRGSDILLIISKNLKRSRGCDHTHLRDYLSI